MFCSSRSNNTSAVTVTCIVNPNDGHSIILATLLSFHPCKTSSILIACKQALWSGRERRKGKGENERIYFRAFSPLRSLFTGYSPVNLHPQRPGDRIFRAGGISGKGEGDKRGKIGVKESLQDALQSSLALLRFWWHICMHT